MSTSPPQKKTDATLQTGFQTIDVTCQTRFSDLCCHASDRIFRSATLSKKKKSDWIFRPLMLCVRPDFPTIDVTHQTKFPLDVMCQTGFYRYHSSDRNL